MPSRSRTTAPATKVARQPGAPRGRPRGRSRAGAPRPPAWRRGERDEEQHLGHRVGERVRRLGQHRRGAADHRADELRGRDEQVRQARRPGPSGRCRPSPPRRRLAASRARRPSRSSRYRRRAGSARRREPGVTAWAACCGSCPRRHPRADAGPATCRRRCGRRSTARTSSSTPATGSTSRLLDRCSAGSQPPGPPGRLVGVYGNNDGPPLRARLPEVARAELGGVRVAVVHETGPAQGREARARRRPALRRRRRAGVRAQPHPVGHHDRRPACGCSTPARPPTAAASRTAPT